MQKTPYIEIDLKVIRNKYEELQRFFPGYEIFYAVKANPHPAVITELAASGAAFDVASPGEIERCSRLRIAPERLSYGNIAKREGDIAAAHRAGISLFAFDSPHELEKLARAAPGAGVVCRIVAVNKGAEWPLSRKFGCDHSEAADLMVRAKKIGLRPLGISFHVGSQQTDPSAWNKPLQDAAHVFHTCGRQGLHLEMVNLGGGLPAQYDPPIPDIADYAEVIHSAVARAFAGSTPRLLIEPGRYLVGDAGILRTEILLVARRGRNHVRWIHLDAGRYNGLPETLDESIRYRIRTSRDSDPLEPTVLAGPTCDSSDILYEKKEHRCQLPITLIEGDTIELLSAGAYTASYASIEFNGFSPIEMYVIGAG